MCSFLQSTTPPPLHPIYSLYAKQCENWLRNEIKNSKVSIFFYFLFILFFFSTLHLIHKLVIHQNESIDYALEFSCFNSPTNNRTFSNKHFLLCFLPLWFFSLKLISFYYAEVNVITREFKVIKFLKRKVKKEKNEKQKRKRKREKKKIGSEKGL